MHSFNLIFTPFGLILVGFAIIFSNPEKRDIIASASTLIFQFIINYYILKNLYHFKKPMLIRKFIILFNIITTSIVFYYISSYWAPAWLLYTMPAIFGSTFLDKKNTIIFSILSSISMLSVYFIKAYILEIEISSTIFTMALSHVFFIITVSIFVNNLSETIVKMKRY
ncbi:MAG: hypothetical protein N2Z20_02640 [Elusimicrobiales bacterium]|nr:hypothetical protein [Elusimicrobiales bacterium]